MWSPIVAVSHAVSYSPIASIMSRSVSYCLMMSNDVPLYLMVSHSVSYGLTMSPIVSESHAVSYSPIGSIMSRSVLYCLIKSHDVS